MRPDGEVSLANHHGPDLADDVMIQGAAVVKPETGLTTLVRDDSDR